MKPIPKPKGEVTRTLILKKTVQLFAKHGFDGTSFQRIADACKLTQAAVLYHFSSRDMLIEETIRWIVTHNNAIRSDSFELTDDARVRLTKHFRLNLAWAVENKNEAQMILLLYYYSCFNPKFSELYGKILASARGRIKETLLAGQREQVFSFTLPVDDLTEILHEALLGGILNIITSPKQSPDRIAAAHLKWDRLITALCNT